MKTVEDTYAECRERKKQTSLVLEKLEALVKAARDPQKASDMQNDIETLQADFNYYSSLCRIIENHLL